MAIVRPFAAYRPPRSAAVQVASPPYDVINTAEARALAAGNPASFLHVSRPEIDLPEGTDDKAFVRAAMAVFEPVLDRSKPVWEMHLFQGLAGGRLVGSGPRDRACHPGSHRRAGARQQIPRGPHAIQGMHRGAVDRGP